MHIRAFDWCRGLAGIVVFLGILSLAQVELRADRIVAVVGDRVITESDLNKVVKSWEYQLRLEASGVEYLNRIQELRRQALKRLIDEELLYMEALKEGITVDPVVVEQEIEKVKARFPSEEEFKESLKSAGMSLKDLYDQIEKKLMVRKLVDKKIRSKIYVNPAEVFRYFRSHKEEFCQIKRVKLDSVFISGPNQDEDEMEFSARVMEEYVKLTKNQTTWKSLKDKYGSGAISGWKSREDLAPSIAKVIFSMKDGVYPMPVRVSTGYMLFRIEEREKDCPRDLKSAKKAVYNYLFKKKFDEKLNAFLKDLRQKYFVKVYQGLTP